jgi:tetratricopeptide (TPR) repeat protein
MRRTGMILLLALLVGGCDQTAPDATFAGLVAVRYGEADRLLDRGDPAAARRVLASITEQPEAGGARTADASQRPLLQDTYFRLARLALAMQDPATAVSDAQAGLALGDHSDLFAANLLIARGAAREALGDARAAAADYEQALRINEALLQEIIPSP